MAAIPTVAEEDARRPTRERETLVREQTRAVNRIKSTWIRFHSHLQGQAAPGEQTSRWLRGPEDEPLPPNAMAELRRDLARLRLIRGDIKE
jgi:transposase